jgi:feruloyl-CoA synthase
MIAIFGESNALARPAVERIDRPDNTFILRNPQALDEPVRCTGEWLNRWANERPDTVFLGERGTDGQWIELTYSHARAQVGAIASSFIDLGLSAHRPIVVLSDNSIAHALICLAAQHVGIPTCAISSSYSRLDPQFSALRRMLAQLDPAFIFAESASQYGLAIAACAGDTLYCFRDDARDRQALAWDQLVHRIESPEVERRFLAIAPQDPVKYLLTSGSTDRPKVVINTHRMLCANQQMIAQVWPFLRRHPLRLVDWLPWSHTFGGNHNFNLVLAHGGSLYIDEGRPTPGLIGKSVANLRDIAPNFYFNVPRGFEMLLPFLENDDAFARRFFGELEGIFYAAAALPDSLWQRLETLAARSRRRPIWFTSSWGSTETSPAVTNVHWQLRRAGSIGIPLPGVELKFVPNGDKLEMRVRGPNVFPGYRNEPQATRAAFDDEGFYRIGDAGRLLDASNLEAGIVFDGRVSEDFKLSSGSWVSVGALRVKTITELQGLASDVVITGHDRSEIGLLIFLSQEAATWPPERCVEVLQNMLRRAAAESRGCSATPKRALILREAPSMAAGEITDKGYINQRSVLGRRSADVERLYLDTDTDVIVA